jgi:hypothetical protein
MATTIKSADLDFNKIKNRLKDYFKSKDEFNSYNFEGAGLNNLLDVLAYNTHQNALTANFALNEAFLPTAQLRSSVLSHAAMLGYETRSRTSSKALVELSLNLTNVPGRPVTIGIPRGTQFTGSVDGVSYTFRTQEAFSARDNGSGTYDFRTSAGSTDIPIFEGIQKTKTFIVGQKNERQIYIVPDETMDKSTARVLVYDSLTSNTFTEYTPLSTAVRIDSETTYYSIHEAPNGTFEINFGDGTSFGKSPDPGQKIVVTYLSSKGSVANGATSFTADSQVSVNGVQYVLSAVLASESSGGLEKQSIESIRQLAPIAFAAQQRLVTSLDYKAIIDTNFSTVKESAVWSGDQNVPIDYGAVYISLNFTTGTPAATKQQVQDQIRANYVKNLSTMSMTPKFVEPKDVFLILTTQFNFDPALTGLSSQTQESNIQKYIRNYFLRNLESFDKTFRKSNLLTEIDALGKAVLNTKIGVKVQMHELIVPADLNTFEVQFPCDIADPDDVFNRIITDAFEFQGTVAVVKNRLSSNQLAVFDLDDNILVDNVGNYDVSSGKVSFVGFSPTRLLSGSNEIKITVVPADDSSIKPLRNYILKLSTETSSASAVLDRQTATLEVN